MFHELARIVLLSPIQVETDDQSKDLRPLQAFAIFRFEREDKRNMIYCYELQVRKSELRTLCPAFC
ncbi:hypothetical protein SCHPADRAFT_35017 [Schizopora paradoxa]|uniref:Uncharacterized protein n=1 Tax=Schizopora paradoxa TaxID=27342 RepID=A0A0H2SEQ3_9AGAM|nr:hypothetical protein SCHPADRAFT_35017 [Schizopora paradoxa]